MLLACDTKTAKDEDGLLELSGTWTQQHSRVDLDSLTRTVPRYRSSCALQQLK